MPNPLERPKLRKTPDTEQEATPLTEENGLPITSASPLKSGVRGKMPKESVKARSVHMWKPSTPPIEVTAPKPKNVKIPTDRPPYTHSELYPEEGGTEKVA